MSNDAHVGVPPTVLKQRHKFFLESLKNRFVSVNLLPISHTCPRVAAMSVRWFSGAKIVVFGGPGVSTFQYLYCVYKNYIIVMQAALLDCLFLYIYNWLNLNWFIQCMHNIYQLIILHLLTCI